MPSHAPLLGLAAVPGRALRLQGQLVVFALVFPVATGTVELPLEHVGAGLFPSRHDAARGAAVVGPLDREDHTTRARPWARVGACRVHAGSLAPPARRGPRGWRADLVGQPLPHRGAREAWDRAQWGWCCAPRQHLGSGQGTGTAPDAPGVGPRVPPPLAHPLAHRPPVGTAAALRLEEGGAQTPREACLTVAWPETIATLRAIVAALCLCTRRAVLGVIDSEHKDLGRTVVGRHTRLHPYQRHARNLGACDAVCQACSRRL
jgi:hypothetical protein